MTTITANMIADAVEAALIPCATSLRPDVFDALHRALAFEEAERGREILKTLIQNAEIACTNGTPICQDTGSVWICLEIGEDVAIAGDAFSKVDDVVARSFRKGNLRMSMAHDALLDRTNTADNTPAFCEIRFSRGSGARLHVLLKGGGSDNASQVLMLDPHAGREGIKKALLERVREKAANACPPLIVGIGVGSTFDKVAGLSKMALLRPVGSMHRCDEVAMFEKELLAAVNATGIGPGALGGTTTALAVHIETQASHIASLPVAINMGCCAMRSTTHQLVPKA